MRAQLLWLVLDAAVCAVLLFAAHHRLRHVPGVLMRPLRQVAYVLVAAGGLFAALEIAQVVQLPPTVLAVMAVAFPALVISAGSASLAGLIAPLAPGILTLRYRRYEVGDRVRITTPGGGAIAEGEVWHIDLYATDLDTPDGDQTVPNIIVQAAVVTILSRRRGLVSDPGGPDPLRLKTRA